MSTLAIVATLDGWTDIKRRLQVAYGGRPQDYLDKAAAGLHSWLEGGGIPATAGAKAATAAMGGCATADELEELRARGLVDCGIDPSSGLAEQCPSTCVPTFVAAVLLLPFIVIAQVWLSILNTVHTTISRAPVYCISRAVIFSKSDKRHESKHTLQCLHR